MMVSIIELGAHLFTFLIGLSIGAVFFGGLWLTTQRLASSKSPALLVMASFFVRMSLVTGVIYLLIQWTNWTHWISFLLAFFLARQLLIIGVNKGNKSTSEEHLPTRGEHRHLVAIGRSYNAD